MKKRSFLFPVLLILSFDVYSQRTDTAAAFRYGDTTTWIYKMEKSHERWNRMGLKTQDFQLFERIPDSLKQRKGTMRGNIGHYGKAVLYWMNDIDGMELAAAGVTPSNAAQFMYHLVANDSVEVVHWQHPAQFRTNDKIQYAYLGKFDTRHKLLRLEFYHTDRYFEKSTWVFNDLYLPPAQLTFARLNYNDQYLYRPYTQHYLPQNKQRIFRQKDWQKDGLRFPWSDSINNIEVDMKNTVQNDMYNVYLKRTVNGKTDTAYISYNWGLSYYTPDPYMSVSSSYFNRPGKYEIIVVPQAPDNFRLNTFSKAVVIPFTVLPPLSKAYTAAQVGTCLAGVLLVCGLIFGVYFFITRRRIAQEARGKEMAALQLQSVRSQLNPHFMFNALAGIQNLINKSDLHGANLYLTKFARLTRSVLDDSKKEMVELAEEKSLIDTYLQMEQLRFGFEYDIRIEESIDQFNTEIPAMLMQPFVENAVKHGVSSLNGKGRISVSVTKEEQALRVDIHDNGKGFSAGTSVAGNGTRLSAERIDLINQLHQDRSISVSHRSDPSGTLVSLHLNGYEHARSDH